MQCVAVRTGFWVQARPAGDDETGTHTACANPAAPLYKAPEPPGQKPRAAFMLLKLQRIRSKASLRNRPPFLGGRLRSGNGPGLNERPEACHDAVERPFSKGRAPPPLVELQEHRWRAKGGDTARGRA
jgi:hypothetical protein